MARVKQSITQRDWSFGELREDFLERGDTDILNQSAKRIRNMQILASGALTTRPGTVDVAAADGACQIKEALVQGGPDRALVPTDGGLVVLLEDGTVEATLSGLPWAEADICDLWIEQSGNQVVIGGDGVKPTVVDMEDLSVSEFEFDGQSDGSTAQPYYNFNPGVEIQPSATTGTVSVTASDGVFTPDYVGTIIRYNGREIIVTGYVSPTEVTGDVIQEAVPTFDVEVTDGTQYSKGDAVEGLISGATGIISSVSGNILTIIVDEVGMEFDLGEGVSGPGTTAGSEPTVVAETEVPPAPSAAWDEQVFSDWRGWPGHAAFHQNRLVFTQIPGIPGGIIMSRAGFNSDFTLGSADGDAIFEVIPNDTILYGVSAQDFLIFGREGVYYSGTRQGDPITPLTFDPRRFSSIGSADVEPVMVDDGVAYLSKCETRMMGAVLTGDVNRYWQDVHIGEYAPHLIRKPTKLGTTTGDSETPEQYLYAVNSDGTLAVLRWQKAPFAERMGWVLWETKGEFVDVQSVFCKTHAIVERNGQRRIERFERGVYVDGAMTYDTFDAIPENDGNAIYAGTRYLGRAGADRIRYPDAWGPFTVGCPFEQQAFMWPRRIDETGRKGFVKQRNGRVAVSTQNSTSFLYNGQRRAFYDGHDDLTAPPVMRTEVHRFCSLGRTDHPCHEISKPEPGPLTILAFNVEVQG